MTDTTADSDSKKLDANTVAIAADPKIYPALYYNKLYVLLVYNVVSNMPSGSCARMSACTKQGR